MLLTEQHVFLFSITKVTVTGVRGFPTLSPSPSSSHLAGLCNWCHQVLIIRVSPAPPADLRLAAASDHCPVLLVSKKSNHQWTQMKVMVPWRLSARKPTCRQPQGSSSRIWRMPHSPVPCRWSILEREASEGNWSRAWWWHGPHTSLKDKDRKDQKRICCWGTAAVWLESLSTTTKCCFGCKTKHFNKLQGSFSRSQLHQDLSAGAENRSHNDAARHHLSMSGLLLLSPMILSNFCWPAHCLRGGEVCVC